MANGIAGDGSRHLLSRWQVLEEENAILSSAPPARAQSVGLCGEDDIVKDAKTGRALLEQVQTGRSWDCDPQNPHGSWYSYRI